tara:strand:+ start:1344 stop:2276 length:933 start_codon:yes stop_codon:yes gene_type:complete
MQNMIKNVTTLLLFYTSILGLAQTSPINSKYNTELDLLAAEGQKIINATLSQDRKKANEIFNSNLKKLIKEDDSILLDLRRVSNLMQVTNEDKTLRVLTWALLDANNTYQYFGFIQRITKNQEYFWTELVDQSAQISDPEKQELTAVNWFGCLYYDMITINNGLKDIHTLVGWDGNNSMSHKKIIENLYFGRDDSVRFGSPIIREAKNAYLYRKIFEFSGDLKMTLDIQKTPKVRIVYDHLSPDNPSLKGVYEYYGPDLSFDAYEWGGRFWDYVADIDMDQNLEKKEKDFEVKDRDTIQSKNLFTPLKGQ